MRIARIGLTPLKGARHLALDHVDLAAEGPVGDRLFCLVDPSRGRVLRTVENPSLVQVTARWEDPELTVALHGRTVSGRPGTVGGARDVDYWGRRAQVEPVDGPWAALLSEHIGYEVQLARVVRPGEVVYGGSVSLVTTGSLRHLCHQVGEDLDSARFRATFLVDTGGTEHDEPHAEERWAGRHLRLGGATLRVHGAVPRCAVVDREPVTGRPGRPVLATLGRYRRGGGQIDFGVDAEVVEPGSVHDGDAVVLGRD